MSIDLTRKIEHLCLKYYVFKEYSIYRTTLIYIIIYNTARFFRDTHWTVSPCIIITYTAFSSINLNEFLIGHYAMYLINTSKLCYFVLCTPLCRFTERRHVFMYRDPWCGTVCTSITMWLGSSCTAMWLSIFSRKVFFVDCLVWKTFILPHIFFNRDMTLAKDNTPCHADRNTQVILVTNNFEHSNDLHIVWT